MSSKVTIVMVLVIIGATALFATKPSQGEIERMLADNIRAEIQSTGSSELATGLLLAACKIALDQCVQLVRSSIDVEIEDKVLWQSVTIAPRPDQTRCLGVLNQLVCPGFLNN